MFICPSDYSEKIAKSKKLEYGIIAKTVRQFCDKHNIPYSKRFSHPVLKDLYYGDNAIMPHFTSMRSPEIFHERNSVYLCDLYEDLQNFLNKAEKEIEELNQQQNDENIQQPQKVGFFRRILDNWIFRFIKR